MTFIVLFIVSASFVKTTLNVSVVVVFQDIDSIHEDLKISDSDISKDLLRDCEVDQTWYLPHAYA